MLSDSEVQHRLNQDFFAAVEMDDAARVQALLRYGSVDPAANESYALRVAAEKGHTAVVITLLNDRRADPSHYNSAALAWAAINGHTQIVQALLQDRRADPAALNSRALSASIRYGHTEIVRLLLRDGRSDPARSQPFVLPDATQASHVETLCLLLAALDPKALKPLATQFLRRSETAQSIKAFLLACISDPFMPRMLGFVRAFLKTDLKTQTVFSLAYEAARRNVDPHILVHLHREGHLGPLLGSMLGPSAEMPRIEDIECQYDLVALASVSKAEPALHAGRANLDVAQFPDILHALAPTLRRHVAHAIWHTLRAQVRGEELTRAYGTPAHRVRDRMASHVLFTALVRRCNAFRADINTVAENAGPLLSTAANCVLLALDALSDAAERGEAVLIKKALTELHLTIDAFDERLTLLGEPQRARCAQRLSEFRSILGIPVDQMAELTRAQAREKTSRKGLALTL